MEPFGGDVHSALKRYFGFEAFKGNQEAIIRTLLGGRDVFVLMPTGGGKSLCYQLPALMSEGVAIVISPLIALMKNQVDAMCQYAGNDAIAHFLNSSLSRSAANQVRADVVSGKTKMLYVAPESLTKEENIKFLRSVPVSFYAVDEAHCISEWGHDFRPEYRRIRPIIKEIGVRPVIALTATATPKVQHDVQRNLGMADAAVFKSSFNRTNLYYEVRYKNKDTDRDLVRFIRSNAGKSGIVYCLSRKRVEEIAEMLRVNDIRALPYHAGLDAATRSANQDAFLHEQADVIVATIAFGMGIDKPNVRFVAHVDMPKSIEGYFQETGRAGRDGEPADAWMAYGLNDVVNQRFFIDASDADEMHKQLCTQKLDAMLGLAEAPDCRRQRLLAYFGEKSEPCGHCDNCLEPPDLLDMTVPAKKFISCIYRIREASGVCFGAQHVIDVLMGNMTDRVARFSHDKLSTWSIGQDLSAAEWRILLRQLVARHVVWVDPTARNALSLGEAARDLLRGNMKISVRKRVAETRRKRREHSQTEALLQEFSKRDRSLYEALRQWRSDEAKSLGKPPYVIFKDATLLEIVRERPTSPEALRRISGVGEKKLVNYGDAVLDIVAAES